MRAQEVETRRCFTCNQQGHLQRDHWKYEEKNGNGPLPKQVGSREGEDETPAIGPRHVPNKSSKVKRAPYLNADAFRRFIGPKNLGKALIDDELATCLLDNGAQLNFITPAYPQKRRNGHYVPGLFVARDRGIHPAHQRPRQHLSGTHWVHHDECQGARCPRV